MNLRVGAEIILSGIIVSTVAWVASFIIDTYRLEAEVSNLKSDITEIKQDTKYIRNYLLERKR